MSDPRVFILSPAHCGGKRAALLLRPQAAFPLAERLRAPSGAPVGEVFSFLSGLYFRGKIAYSRRFSSPPTGAPGALIVTPDRGLVEPSTPVRPADLRSFADVPVDLRDPRYGVPLRRSLRRLAGVAGGARFVLLGSVASRKYVEPMLEELGDTVWFPAPFVGMGDMQRGALMLRAAESGEELPYVSAAGALRSRAAGAAPIA